MLVFYCSSLFHKPVYPKGFYGFGRNIGIKDETLDFAVIFSEVPCRASGVFTKNNFPGAPVVVGKEHIRSGFLQAIVINSKNSNVATGDQGIAVARETCRLVAESLGIKENLVLPSSTGVIGVPLPKEKVFSAASRVREYLKEGNLEEVATAIMTTDKKRKTSRRTFGAGTVYGIAKGAGMIEPNMATMLSYVMTDLIVESDDLYSVLKRSADISFNRMTVDSDTSTSDTLVLMSNGLSGVKISEKEFETILSDICIDLAKQIAADAEGATKLIILDIEKAQNENQGTKIAKSILNSPLVKTAVYGGDPNWGRLVMAVGKVFDEKIPYENLSIKIGGMEVKGADAETKIRLSEYLKKNSEVQIGVHLGTGNFSGTFYGCDMSEDYVRENAYYTT